MPRVARKTAVPRQIEFNFIKSNFFRVVRADGAFGGLAPNGAIHMGIYSERSPIPKRIFHDVGPGGELGPELTEKREGRGAVVREMEVDVVLEIAQAMALRQWLDERIHQYEKIVGPLPTVPAKTTVKANGHARKKS